jgi:transposase InsO family protein
LDINVLNEMFGHPNSQVLAATAAKYGLHTKNDLHFCSNCAISKSKQKNKHKLIANPSMELRGRINIDISSVQNTSYGGANVWHLIQDDFTGCLWSYFIKAKNDLPDTLIDWLKLVQKEIKLNVKSICLDNYGENKSFHQMITKSELNIKFEFTAPGTPQQNGKVERAFATLFAKT